MKTLTISHADYSNSPSFARVTGAAFDGAAVLPNMAVMSACLRDGGRRKNDVQIELFCDGDFRSAYRVGGERGWMVIIDAQDGSHEEVSLGCMDDDSAAAEATMYAALAAEQVR